jgi:hypothetical protein
VVARGNFFKGHRAVFVDRNERAVVVFWIIDPHATLFFYATPLG